MSVVKSEANSAIIFEIKRYFDAANEANSAVCHKNKKLFEMEFRMGKFEYYKGLNIGYHDGMVITSIGDTGVPQPNVPPNLLYICHYEFIPNDDFIKL